MFATLLLASLSAAPAITGATQGWDGHRLTVTVAASGPLDGEVHATLAPRALKLALPATIESDELQLGAAEHPMRVRRTGEGVLLEAPIGGRIACTGSPVVALTETGLVATAVCALRESALAARDEHQSILAAVALPPPAPVASTPSEPERDQQVPPAPPAPVVAAAAPAGPVVARPTGTLASTGPETSSTTLVLPALSLLALVGVALFTWRKKGRPDGLVQVLETASLGPKRSLVVTRAGGRTLLLGSSEAGIALLATLEAQGAPEATSAEIAGTQAGLLAKWMGKAPRGQPEPRFDDLLAETAADLDLRRKLEAGLPGRVA
jgi:flagellar protein FliO/FliZ